MADAPTGRHPLAPGAFFAWRGVTYFLPRQTIGDQRLFHAWANARALADLADLEEMVRAGQYDRRRYEADVEAVRTWVTTGHYSFKEPGGIERRFTLEGLAAQCWLAMRRHDPAVTFEQVLAVAEDDAGPLSRAFADANAAPTTPAPAPTAADEMAYLCQTYGLSPAEIERLSEAEIRDLYARPHPYRPATEAAAEAGDAAPVHPDVVLIDALRRGGKTTEEIQAVIDARRRELAARAAG